MIKLLTLSDDGLATGYGRISVEVNSRLVQRGYQNMSMSLYFDGLLPPQYDGRAIPYHVGSLAGKANWLESFINVVNAWQPDVILVVQDAPYAEQLRNAPLDWSRYALIVITPVDGAPVHPAWVSLLKQADGVLSISQFGVNAHRAAGIPSELCQPGIDPNRFFPLPENVRQSLRVNAGIKPDAFVLGTMAMNQGRKSIPDMLRAFFRFSADKPDARYILDMEATSPAGWDIPSLCIQQGWDASKLIFRNDLAQKGITDIRDRYNLLDAHTVISHREGWGLPLVEAMACGVVSIAMDWCSGTEICNDGKGILIPPIAYDSIGTWGGALDKYVDVDALTQAFQRLYENPDERRAIARKGMEWARQQSWSAATDNVVKVIERVVAKRQQQAQPPAPVITPPPPVVAHADGVMHNEVALLESVG